MSNLYFRALSLSASTVVTPAMATMFHGTAGMVNARHEARAIVVSAMVPALASFECAYPLTARKAPIARGSKSALFATSMAARFEFSGGATRSTVIAWKGQALAVHWHGPCNKEYHYAAHTSPVCSVGCPPRQREQHCSWAGVH